MTSRTLDVKGLRCPIPILKTRTTLKEIRIGEKLEVLATDPNAATDFPVFCRVTGNDLLEQSHASGVFRFVIRRIL